MHGLWHISRKTHEKTLPIGTDREAEPEQHMGELVQALSGLRDQMDAMGQRMGAMEQSIEEVANTSTAAEPQHTPAVNVAATANSAGHSDIPSVTELRTDQRLNREVNRRIAELKLEDELTDNSRTGSSRSRGKRSGAARTVQDTIGQDIDWPHFHIYSAPGAEPMTYDNLSITEFTYGYLHMVDRPDSKFERQVMWDLLKAIMEDAAEYPWPNVKNFFFIVGSKVENARLEWADSANIAKLRAKHAQKHIVVKKAPAQSSPPPQTADFTKRVNVLRRVTTPALSICARSAIARRPPPIRTRKRIAGESRSPNNQQTGEGGSNRLPPYTSPS